MARGGNPVFAGNKNFKASSAYSGQSRSFSGETGAGMTSAQLQDLYNAPPAGPAQTGRMTYDDVIIKTVGTLALVLVGAAAGWIFPILTLPGMLVGLILGLVNAFKREPSPALILLYAVFEGAFLGGLSGFLEGLYPGIVVQAVIGSLSVFAVTLLLFKSGKVRATPKSMKIFMIALGGYALFSLINLGLMVFNVTSSPWGIRSMDIPGTSIPFGVVLGLLAVGLAAFSLVMDFTSIQQGVTGGIPAKYSWTAAFGLTVTLVWLYVEILRLLAILRGNN
ncbi:Bax inhibitor-1/YccA family protein [Paenarthrobacter sp. Z7-10]|uniref:Bax inhibitor-1/YccA family protein n=1 Tax=Paenarthrobacter sp. Z7-10 TaxID=2787635 RepID=UPI0022A978D2|nr:Bax inhibitor-1/YccA family protein [Paenarthrobacter sp. Z7-10]MCZ2404414.1 Bax inhibitor-1/YccA family protein [Paenarthrobacter sp. Z7-10]